MQKSLRHEIEEIARAWEYRNEGVDSEATIARLIDVVEALIPDEDPSSPEHHVRSIYVVGKYQAQCSCGWKGIASQNLDTVEQDGHVHLVEMREEVEAAFSRPSIAFDIFDSAGVQMTYGTVNGNYAKIDLPKGASFVIVKTT